LMLFYWNLSIAFCPRCNVMLSSPVDVLSNSRIIMISFYFMAQSPTIFCPFNYAIRCWITQSVEMYFTFISNDVKYYISNLWCLWIQLYSYLDHTPCSRFSSLSLLKRRINANHQSSNLVNILVQEVN